MILSFWEKIVHCPLSTSQYNLVVLYVSLSLSSFFWNDALLHFMGDSINYCFNWELEDLQRSICTRERLYKSRTCQRVLCSWLILFPSGPYNKNMSDGHPAPSGLGKIRLGHSYASARWLWSPRTLLFCLSLQFLASIINTLSLSTSCLVAVFFISLGTHPFLILTC